LTEANSFVVIKDCEISLNAKLRKGFSGVGMNAIQARNLVVFGLVPITEIIGGNRNISA
jgi:hypothetical protein